MEKDIIPVDTIVTVSKTFLDSNLGELNHNFKIGAKVKIIQHPRTGYHYKKKMYHVESAEEIKYEAYNESTLKFWKKNWSLEFMIDYPKTTSFWLHEKCIEK